MSTESRLTIHTAAAAAAAIALLLAGSGLTYLFMRNETRLSNPTHAITPGAAASRGAARPTVEAQRDAPLPDVVVPVSSEAVQRAGIVVAEVGTGAVTADLRLPGIVEPNAYRQVSVTPLVAGRITRVSAALGDRVRRGQTIAAVYSPQLAEAQARYISARAMLDAHERELQRTRKLADIGAASRQELERIHAEHDARGAAVESARSQLELFGMPASAIDALATNKDVNAIITVTAPADGIVTERSANVGLNVDPATKLFTVADLSTVWIVADVYERDFPRVHVGTNAHITTSALPELALSGRINYIDPQVDAATRTANVRIEVANPRGELRVGTYVDVVVSAAGRNVVPTIPRTAVQNVGDRTVVYLANSKTPGTFVEREVRLGSASGERVEVTSGLTPGESIVTEGSFFVRAERERLGLRSGGVLAASLGQTPVQSAKVIVNEQGFQPTRVSLRAGTPAQITFVRSTDATCATDVSFPSEKITRALPLNTPVLVELTPAKTGPIEFVCGMNMFKGVVVVE
jgi:RND family efflux transporter MFP subunit